MSSQPRLHIARTSTIETAFDSLFASFAEVARSHLGQTEVTLIALWDYAQYLDLADAGYGKKSDSLYAMVRARCRDYLVSHGHSKAVRNICGKTCSLADLLTECVDEQFEYSASNAKQFDAAQKAA